MLLYSTRSTHPELSSPGSFSGNFICQQFNVQAGHCATTTRPHTKESEASVHYIIANTLTSALATRGSCFWIDWHLDSTFLFVLEQAPAQGVGIVVVLIGATRSWDIFEFLLDWPHFVVTANVHSNIANHHIQLS